ncbi:MAG: EF-hand domain-containing protein [Phycisphaerales bacterium]|nr:EF-hand domain-containing protein [Phycisphaerales bacterium]
MQSKIAIVGLLGIGAAAIGAIVVFGGGQDKSILAEAGHESIQNKQLAMDTNSSYDLSSTGDELPIAIEEIEQRVPDQANPNNSQQAFSWDNMFDRMSQFDIDGDGILSEEERDAMRKAMREERMAMMDLDGDGEISREERRAARQQQFENSERGQALMRRFDLDGDGVLSPEEQAAMDEYNQEQRAARQTEQLAQYDLDGDGELSREERNLQREEQKSRFESMKEQATLEFDYDGDGQLNIEESQDAMNAYRAQREIERFVNRFDTDGDGAMGPNDYDSFANDFANGDMSADVNGDGVVDTADLAAYRDMVTQSSGG